MLRELSRNEKLKEELKRKELIFLQIFSVSNSKHYSPKKRLIFIHWRTDIYSLKKNKTNKKNQGQYKELSWIFSFYVIHPFLLCNPEKERTKSASFKKGYRKAGPKEGLSEQSSNRVIYFKWIHFKWFWLQPNSSVTLACWYAEKKH